MDDPDFIVYLGVTKIRPEKIGILQSSITVALTNEEKKHKDKNVKRKKKHEKVIDRQL